MNPDSQTTRRQMLRGAAAASLFAMAVPSASEGSQDRESNQSAPTDRDHVLAAGMTEAEADAWKAAADAAAKFFALPELHPMDRQEVASAIHVLQNKLLSRPTYRAYLKHAKGER